jgi:large subunit ribosomal protein L22
MKASLTNYKQSPRKVRLVADMIRGKNVLVAKDSLIFLAKKSAPEIMKLLDSAIANAKQQGMSPEDLFVQSIAVDKGSVIKRFTPKARGRAAGIRRTMSHVTLTLGQSAKAKAAAAKSEKTEKAPKAKKASKKKSSK